ncbi:MAG: DUF952 domain-containing protein [Bacteroidia bacterium]
MIYHLATKEDWERALQKGVYQTASLKSEGFIHFSTQSQMINSADLFFAGYAELVVLEVPDKNVAHLLKWEPAADRDELFPHVYGALPLELIADTHILMRIGDRWERV